MPTVKRFSVIGLVTTALAVLYWPISAAGDLNVTDSEFEKIAADICSIMKTTFCCHQSENEKVQAFCRDSRLKLQCTPPKMGSENVANFTLGLWNPVEGILNRNPDIDTNADGLNITDSKFDKISTDMCLGINMLFCCEIGKMEGRSAKKFCEDPRMPEFCPALAPAPGMALPEFATLFVNLNLIENIFKRRTSIGTKEKNE